MVAVVTTQLSQLTKSLATQLLLIQRVLYEFYGLVSVFVTLASGCWNFLGYEPPFFPAYFPFCHPAAATKNHRNLNECVQQVCLPLMQPARYLSLTRLRVFGYRLQLPAELYLGHQPVVGADKKAVPL